MRLITLLLFAGLAFAQGPPITINQTQVQGGIANDCLKVNSNKTLGQATCGGGGGGSGTVTSVATSNGITGGTITTSGTISGINAAANGTTKGVSAFTAADFDASAGVISLDYTNGQKASGSQPGFLSSTDWTTFNNKGSGNGTVTSVATTSPIGGGTFTTTGTITCTTCATAAGTLTNTALVTGGGSKAVQTSAATATMDSSGNISTPGSVTTGAGGATAGAIDMGAGTAHTFTGVGWQAPTSIGTPFGFTLPGAPAAGLLHATNATPSVVSVSAVNLAGADVTGVLPTANIAVALANQTSLRGNSMAAAAGDATITQTIAHGAKALATGAISSAACTSAQTDTATGAATTDVVDVSFNGDPTGVTGYVPLTAGMLTIIAYPTSGTVNFKVCNNTTGSITPGAITLNWAVRR